MSVDEQKLEIYQALEAFHSADNEVFELCAFSPKVPRHKLWEGFAGGKKGVVAGWFNDKTKAVETAVALDAIGTEGIYTTINPCKASLLGRANNRLKAGVERTKDEDIVRLARLLIDIDPERPAGISSSDAEHDFALEHAQFVAANLAVKGWPEPLMADSGNGGHLVYRLPDLENTKETAELLSAVLNGLDSLFQVRRGDMLLKVDTRVFNPARLVKLYGTTARKGDSIPDRPHRRARIL